MAARHRAALVVVTLGLPLVLGGETEIDFDYLMKQEARTLIIAFYGVLFLFPVGRWLVYRYTAKIASASQAYLDSLSAKLSEAKGGIASAALKAKGASQSGSVAGSGD